MNLKELKIRAKELEMKKYNSMNKKELIEAIEKTEKLKLEKVKWIEYILKNGEKKYKKSSGSAFDERVDDCPINARVFKGKSYANIMSDCDCCEFELGVSENLGAHDRPEQFIICGGKKKIKRKDYGLRIPFDSEKFFHEKIKEHKHVYICKKCGVYYFDEEVFKCNYTEKKELSSYTCNNCGSNKLIKHQKV